MEPTDKSPDGNVDRDPRAIRPVTEAEIVREFTNEKPETLFARQDDFGRKVSDLNRWLAGGA